jgi:hypothetical protein
MRGYKDFERGEGMIFAKRVPPSGEGLTGRGKGWGGRRGRGGESERRGDWGWESREARIGGVGDLPGMGQKRGEIFV